MGGDGSNFLRCSWRLSCGVESFWSDAVLRCGPVIMFVVSEIEAVAGANHMGPVVKKQRITTTTQVRKAKWAGISVVGGSVVVVCCCFDGGVWVVRAEVSVRRRSGRRAPHTTFGARFARSERAPPNKGGPAVALRVPPYSRDLLGWRKCYSSSLVF